MLANQAKFDVSLPLPGSLWNNYLVWSTTLETNFPYDECSGFCYFQDPNPSECGFAVSDIANGIPQIPFEGTDKISQLLSIHTYILSY